MSAAAVSVRVADRLLQVDAKPTPLRTLVSDPSDQVNEAQVLLGVAPGIGIEPDFEALHQRLAARRR